MIFFEIFFSVAHLPIKTKLFLFLPKFHIFSRSEKSWGDKKRYKQTTTNEHHKRTPQTIIITRQDSFRILGLITREKINLFTWFLYTWTWVIKLTFSRRYFLDFIEHFSCITHVNVNKNQVSRLFFLKLFKIWNCYFFSCSPFINYKKSSYPHSPFRKYLVIYGRNFLEIYFY